MRVNGALEPRSRRVPFDLAAPRLNRATTASAAPLFVALFTLVLAWVTLRLPGSLLPPPYGMVALMVVAVLPPAAVGIACVRAGRLPSSAEWLAAAAVTSAWLAGDWGGAALLSGLLVASASLVSLVEHRSFRSRSASRALDNAPDGAGQTYDAVAVEPGETIPFDARVVSGSSVVDESRVVRGPAHREVRPGEHVFAGSINRLRPLVLERTDSTGDLSIDEAASAAVKRAVRERGDRAERIHRAAVVWSTAVGVLAPGTSIVLVLTGTGIDKATHLATGLLIVASPLAFWLAWRMPLQAAIMRVARIGVIVGGGAIWERLALARAAVWSKLGILTDGNPAVNRVVAVPPAAKGDVLQVATWLLLNAGVRALRHPHAQALLRHTEAYAAVGSVQNNDSPVAEYIEGAGVRGEYSGRMCYVGNRRLLTGVIEGRTLEAHTSLDDLAPDQTTVLVASGNALLGAVHIGDTLRRNIRSLVHEMVKLGFRHQLLLSGDHPRAVSLVARLSGLATEYALLSPARKMELVSELRAKSRGPVLGLGLPHDASVLSACDVPVVIGAVAHVGRCPADSLESLLTMRHITFLGSDLSPLPTLVRLARRTRRYMATGSALVGLGKGVALYMVFAARPLWWVGAIEALVVLGLIAYGGRLRK